MPNEETFPFTEITLKLIGGKSCVLEGEELAAALQYIPSQGYPPLLQLIREFQTRAHTPPPLWGSRDVVIVAGGQDGLSKALEAIIGPGDPILVQDPFYPGAGVVVIHFYHQVKLKKRITFNKNGLNWFIFRSKIAPHQAELIPVPQDDLGVRPDILRNILVDRQMEGKKMPKLMYINPTGVNPTGAVFPLERRKEIYRIACEYNFLLLDDDPYHFMYFTEVTSRSSLIPSKLTDCLKRPRSAQERTVTARSGFSIGRYF